MMKTNIAIALVMLLLCTTTVHATLAFDWATVGNAGNTADNTGYGAVSYDYRISKYEVTNAQYATFLNAVAATDSFGLYNTNMGSDARGGNSRSGTSGNYTYATKTNMDNKPVNYVSFFDAMRFTNWLQNGQGSGGTESGVYTIGTGLSETRDPNATYFIPSENEWYKAAYHKNNGVTGGATNYFEYPTSTDAVPYSDQPPGSGAPTQSNTANFFKNDGIANGYDDGYAVTGSPNFSISQNYLTDVGAYTASLSPYGTFDQGGNVWEWNEAVTSSARRGLRGGNWLGVSGNLAASDRSGFIPTSENSFIGFRVASIPEPSTGLLGVLGMLGLMQRRRRSS